MPLKNIYLIGPMGAGKSTIGRMLARDLGQPFYDSDHVIEEHSGADIPWIFDVEGEVGFRDRETQVLEELCGQHGIVMATGGGAVGKAENRRFLGSNGVVVYLTAPVHVQLQRTEKDKKRPLLQRPDREEVLTKLLKERDPLYRSIADLVLDTVTLSPKGVIAEIIQYMNAGRGV
ncbi:shikimate kinase [Endozoicomonas sp. (ex Bugula neritina AB1)]|nr:shikimate kinase [Endozoicomonas sp. (ex Bugula neritina AB1)]